MTPRLFPLRRIGVADFGMKDGHTQPAVHDHIVGSSWPQPIPTKPGLLPRAWRWVRCSWLRARIWMTEDWLRECARDGITDSLNLREFRRDVEVMRCELAMLEAGK